MAEKHKAQMEGAGYTEVQEQVYKVYVFLLSLALILS
jgi:hypothetical protein